MIRLSVCPFVVVALGATLSGRTAMAGSPTQIYPPSFDLKPAVELNLNAAVGAVLSRKAVRVLVFPHHAAYSDPQGRESIIDRVRLKSTGGSNANTASSCTIYGLGNQTQTTQGLDLSLSASSVAQSASKKVEITCSNPITVERESSLHSFSYVGKLLITTQRTRAGALYLQIVNQLSIEDYLKGVVPSEMGRDAPLESLKAQAVAARTYALWSMAHAPASPDYELDDTVQYQAYTGAVEESSAATLAVNETASIVALFHGSAIKAYFSDDSGGRTEDASEVFENTLPYCISKHEVYPTDSVHSGWTDDRSMAEIQRQLRGAGLISAKEHLTALQISSRDRSGRAQKMLLQFESGKKTEIRATDFRYATHVKSTLFLIKLVGRGAQFNPTVHLVGRGWGHGVGMSQRGAMALASRLKWDYRQILEFYYSDIELSARP